MSCRSAKRAACGPTGSTLNCPLRHHKVYPLYSRCCPFQLASKFMHAVVCRQVNNAIGFPCPCDTVHDANEWMNENGGPTMRRSNFRQCTSCFRSSLTSSFRWPAAKHTTEVTIESKFWNCNTIDTFLSHNIHLSAWNARGAFRKR